MYVHRDQVANGPPVVSVIKGHNCVIEELVGPGNAGSAGLVGAVGPRGWQGVAVNNDAL